MSDPTALALSTLAELRGVNEEDWTHGTLTELGLRLHRLRAMQAFLQELIAEIEESAAADMETETMDIPGLGRLRREEKTSESWRAENSGAQMRDDLAVAVAQSVAMDNATGEIDPMKRNVAMAAMRLAYEAIPSFSTLKVAGRSRLGLHIGDYRSFTDAGYAVKVEAVGETL